MRATLWFAHCGKAEAGKTEYHKLFEHYHPDLGSAEERDKRTGLMQEINAAYAQVSAINRHEEMRAKAREYDRAEPAARDYADAAAVDERIRQAMERIITLGGIEIEICGLWVWVSGNTKPHRAVFKSAGYRWESQKACWYFAGVPSAGFRSIEMEEIRQRYKNQRVVWRSEYAPARAEE